MSSEKLQAALPGKVFVQNTQEYDSFPQSYSFRSARQKPLCAFRPSSATDVSTAITILAALEGAKFAVRSGGHSPHPDMSNTDQGVTFDLRGLDSITKSTEKEHVYKVGVGASWGSVYQVLDKEGRTALGSRETGVGVGGFLLGGGLSHFAPELGFACDMIVSMEVVLASGDVIEVSESSHADLFRVLKGAGSNFGVVTRIDITTIPHHSVWGGSIMYPYDTRDANLKALFDLKTANSYDPFAQTELSFLYAPQMGGYLISNNHWYLRPTEKPKSFQQFANIQPKMQDTMRVDTIQAFTTELSQYQPRNHFALFATTTFQVNIDILTKLTILWEGTSNILSTVNNIVSVVTYQQCPPPPKDSSNAMGFSPNSKPHEDLIILALTMFWESAEDSSSMTQETKALMVKMEELTKKEGLYHPFKYANYAAPWQDPFKSYGEESYLAMKKVSEKYDPAGFFQTQREGFKL